MSLLVLSADEVERLLTMDACIEAMAEVLAALVRDELYQPLRFVVKPPGAAGLMGFMPAHRGGERAAYSLKEIVVTPDNPTRGLDAHQGAVLLHDGRTGELTALVNASPITAIRTGAVSAVATRALARPGARSVAIVGTGVQGKAHEQALCAVLGEDVEVRSWSRSSGGSPEEIVREADVVCTCTNSSEPVLSLAWLKPGAHVNAVGSSVPWARELDAETMAAGSLFADKRESTLNESGEYRTAVEEGAIGPEHILAELGEVLIGAHPGRTRDDELTIFVSLGLAVEDLAAAELVVARAREQGLGVEVDF
ncbi:MAG: ornithine cyclodeaminase family protein [Gaiellaceae bacterium MAG52_C11]|nr:ornithine cyclodeaminase family protein [Candidatus Gaiellasilicea maunaloa]